MIPYLRFFFCIILVKMVIYFIDLISDNRFHAILSAIFHLINE